MLQQQRLQDRPPTRQYNVSDIFNVKDLSPYHGDEEFDPRKDLPQGRGDDAEHPKVIPMDLPSSHQVPCRPMTRACARALQTEVTSLLSQVHFNAHETWILPQTKTLCILRYQGVSREESKEQGESEEEDGCEEEDMRKKLHAPDVR